jgi:hypothetical protein
VAGERWGILPLNMGLPVISKAEDPADGVSYEFKADLPGAPVLTGHANGVITINLAEADDAERERRRVELGEPYLFAKQSEPFIGPTDGYSFVLSPAAVRKLRFVHDSIISHAIRTL